MLFEFIIIICSIALGYLLKDYVERKRQEKIIELISKINPKDIEIIEKGNKEDELK